MENKNQLTLSILAVILLAAILGVQIFGMVTFGQQSQACTDLLAAQDYDSPAQLSLMLSSYETDVYDRAENINQQMLLAQENIFASNMLLIRQNANLRQIIIECIR